jgi:hypothetical protein
MRKYANITINKRRPLVIYDFATAPLLNFLIHEENFNSFLSVIDRQCAGNRKNELNLNGDHQSSCKFVPHCVLVQGASLRQYIGAGIYYCNSTFLYLSISIP